MVRARLSNTILAKYIRIHPVTWKGTPALRVEFIGAYVGELRYCNLLAYLNLNMFSYKFVESLLSLGSIS